MGEAIDPNERMVVLGKLAAGLAHEFNNPVAAASRAAGSLQENIQNFNSWMWKLSAMQLSDEQRRFLQETQARLQEREGLFSSDDLLARSDLEDELAQWLEAHQVPEIWQFVAALVWANLDLRWLDQAGQLFVPEELHDILAWLEGQYSTSMLIHQIEQSTKRMADLVKAVRVYAYQDQKPVKVDLHESLENTLVILSHKLKEGIKLVREYDPGLPQVLAYGSEVSQVWTNIIDNSIDALGGSGTISIHTAQEEGDVLVEIADDGPGIPAEIQSRIFDPFFTTKEAGQGTGLGLEISYRIVVNRHHGELRVDSRPGETRFQVRLPVAGAVDKDG